MSIKERRLRNTWGSPTASKWVAPTPRKKTQRELNFDPTWLMLLIPILMGITLTWNTYSSVSTARATENIILTSQYDKMTLELEGQTTLVGNKFYLGDRKDAYASSDYNFAFKENDKMIYAPLKEGQYYKIYKIPSTNAYYAETYDPSVTK
jgi:hypothetical protein